MKITQLAQLFSALKGKSPKRLVVVNALDDHTLEAVGKAVEMGIVEVILTGEQSALFRICDRLGIDHGKFIIEPAGSD
jgi:phosphotransacetylase